MSILARPENPVDFDIKELSLTLVCGLYATVLVGIGVAYMHPKISIRDAMRAPFMTANLDASLFSLLAMFAILMSIGICAEDLSQNAAAGRGPGFFDQPLREIVPSEASIRLGVLFEGEDNASVADLCESIAAYDFPAMSQRFDLTDLGGRYLSTVVKKAPPATDQMDLTCKKLREIYYPTYYTAKNRVYRQDNYYAELKAIHARGSFGRTMTYISAIGLISLAVVVCWSELLTQLARVIAPRHRRPRLITIGAIGAASMIVIGFLAIPYQEEKWLATKFTVTCAFLVVALLILLVRVVFSLQRREFCGVALLMAAVIVPFRYMYITEYRSYAIRVFGYAESLEMAQPISNTTQAAPPLTAPSNPVPDAGPGTAAIDLMDQPK